MAQQFEFEDEEDEELFEEVIVRLNRDLRLAADTLSEKEAGYLVSAYYNLQELRIRCGHQFRRLQEFDKPGLLITWLAKQSTVLEGQIRAALDRFSKNHKFGPWPRSVIGIGPVISAGLIAHTHMDHLPTAGHFWSFAGLDPNMKWGKGEIRPYNAQLKVLSWKIGHSFMMTQGNPKGFYGKLYKAKKVEYQDRNDAGGFKENARKALREKNWRKTTIAYQHYIKDILPPGHIDAMARRFAAKIFMSHYWEVCWRMEHPGQEPPLPFAIAHLDHVHHLRPADFERYVETITKGKKPE